MTPTTDLETLKKQESSLEKALRTGDLPLRIRADLRDRLHEVRAQIHRLEQTGVKS
jgi:hypothetical protein